LLLITINTLQNWSLFWFTARAMLIFHRLVGLMESSPILIYELS